MERLSRKLSPETKEKISQANTGQKRAQEVKDKISRANMGKAKTPETKKKISDALKDYWMTIPEN
jgi:NUMOD3 motif.